MGIDFFNEQAFDFIGDFGLFAELRGEFLGDEAGDDLGVFGGAFATGHGGGAIGDEGFGGEFVEGGIQGDALAIAKDFEGDGFAGFDGADHEAQAAAAVDAGAVGVDDDVTGFDAGFFSGGIATDHGDEGATLILEAEGFGFFEVEVGDLNTEVAALDFAVI